MQDPLEALKQCCPITNIFQKEHNPPKDKGNLYLSSVYLLDYPSVFQQNKIDCIFTIIDKYYYQTYEIQTKIKQLNIKEHKWIDLIDGFGVSIYDHLHQAHTYIKEMLLNHNVLVHCQEGRCRSPSLVVAFLIKEYGLTYEQAQKHTKSKRQIIQINRWFQRDLQRFAQQVKNSLSSTNKQ